MRLSRSILPALASVVLLAAAAAPAHAATVPADAISPFGDLHVDFSTVGGSDTTVANAGDVNGDGIDDTGVMFYAYQGGSAWITFSPPNLPASISPGGEGWSGLQITGQWLWFAVAGVGDVNADGFDDVAVETVDGDLVVVFGRADSATVDLANLGDDGFRITHVAFGMATGFGSPTVDQNTTLASAGDQNGDGRDDVAFRDGQAVKVAYTPASPAGATLDSDALGDGGFTLDTGATPSDGDPFVGRLGDLNGDGREDLAVSWQTVDDHVAHGVGVVSPGAGETVDLRNVVDDKTGFEFRAEDSGLDNAVTIADRNGDGRRDLGLVVFGPDPPYRNTSLVIGYGPAELGTRRTVLPPQPDEGEEVHIYNGNVIDVGDQDGDGRSDLAFSDVVGLTSSGGAGVINPDLPGGAIYLTRGSSMVASVADRNGDGKRELVAVHNGPYEDGATSPSGWVLDVFLSAPAPVPEDVAVEPTPDGDLQFDGTFVTAPEGDMRSLAARASVELAGGGQQKVLGGRRLIDASRPKTHASVRVDPKAAGLVPGRAYTYRMRLENGRGLVARSSRKTFTYRPPPNVRRGTAGRDRLYGTNWIDVIRALKGDDVVYGRAGNDTLYGGDGADALYGEGGRDRLVAGPGRDRVHAGTQDDVVGVRDGKADEVWCGPGHDRVTADRADDLHGCEHVER